MSDVLQGQMIFGYNRIEDAMALALKMSKDRTGIMIVRVIDPTCRPPTTMFFLRVKGYPCSCCQQDVK